MEISPCNSGFLISIFNPIISNDKSCLSKIAPPKILFPFLTFSIVREIIFLINISKNFHILLSYINIYLLIYIL